LGIGGKKFSVYLKKALLFGGLYLEKIVYSLLTTVIAMKKIL
jgi:hypothetical protein